MGRRESEKSCIAKPHLELTTSATYNSLAATADNSSKRESSLGEPFPMRLFFGRFVGASAD
jgi:hypothetical protein